MIILFTDFGSDGPYVGQLHAILHQRAAGIPVINLFSDAPSFNPRASAYLLAAYIDEFPEGSVFLCVVDPGVGTQTRKPVIVHADHYWFVGPDNGLFSVITSRAAQVECLEILWQPERLSDSFHGRDLFAPVAAMLATGSLPEHTAFDCSINKHAWPDDLGEVIYIDHFGNAITGIRASTLPLGCRIMVNGQPIDYARTFGAAPVNTPFWYANANGLVELAVPQGNAAHLLECPVGTLIDVIRPTVASS